MFLSRRRRQAELERKRSFIEMYLPHLALGLREILARLRADAAADIEPFQANALDQAAALLAVATFHLHGAFLYRRRIAPPVPLAQAEDATRAALDAWQTQHTEGQQVATLVGLITDLDLSRKGWAKLGELCQRQADEIGADDAADRRTRRAEDGHRDA